MAENYDVTWWAISCDTERADAQSNHQRQLGNQAQHIEQEKKTFDQTQASLKFYLA